MKQTLRWRESWRKSEMVRKVGNENTHPFHTRTKGEDSKVHSRMWQHSFSKEFPTLGESTVRLFKKQYEAKVRRIGPEQEISHLPKKRGRPLTLGELDGKVQQYVRSLRRAGTPVNARIVIATAEGIIKATDRTMLIENGGHIQLTLAWAYSLLQRMGFVQRKATTKTKTSL